VLVRDLDVGEKPPHNDPSLELILTEDKRFSNV
jgi:hypothetical protein